MELCTAVRRHYKQNIECREIVSHAECCNMTLPDVAEGTDFRMGGRFSRLFDSTSFLLLARELEFSTMRWLWIMECTQNNDSKTRFCQTSRDTAKLRMQKGNQG